MTKRITYTITINGQTFTTRKLTEAYKMYDKAINNGQTATFTDNNGRNIADR